MKYALRSGSVEEIGGKALALARLTAAELPIPPWFAVPPEAFVVSLDEEQRRLLNGENAEMLQRSLSSLRLAQNVAEEIATALEAVNGQGGRFAVRSSAVEEDSAENSFAGQLDTYLFVEPEAVAARIADVWRSGFGARLVEYRRQRRLAALPQSAPAVLVQQMVDADAAGVAFSADPVSGRRGIAIVSAVFGLGTALVGGDADADTFHVDRSGAIEEQSIAVKKMAHRFDPAAEEGVSARPVPEELQQRPALPPEHTAAVAALARRAAAVFGQPQDIEWAVQNGAIYLLQSRPITTLRGVADPDGVLNLWDNSNITESYSGVTTPLTFSFARSSYESVYRQFCRILNVPERTLIQNDRVFRNMLGLIRGRVYYNLLNWYRALALLPGFTLNHRFMEQMMGVRESLPESTISSGKKAGAGEKLIDSLHVAAMLFGLLRNYLTLNGQIEKFNSRLKRALAEPSPRLCDMRLDELTAHFVWLQQELGARWDAPLSNDFFAMIFHGTLRKLTAAWCGGTSGMLANDAIRGRGIMISAEPAARVRELAKIARESSELVDALCSAPLERVLETLRRHSEFRAGYDAYLEKFGDRCLEELKLESETLHENPTVLLRSIGELARAEKNGAADVRNHSATLSDAQAALRERLNRAPLKRAVLGWVLRNAGERVRQRENLRFERTRLFGRMRRIFLEAGKRLQAMGELDDHRDIFYVEAEEIVALVDGTATTTDLRALVKVRKEEFSRYRQSPSPPERFETRGVVYFAREYASRGGPRAADCGGEERRGIGCCPGVVRGSVRVVRDPRNAQLPAGSILVADHTDPGWIMLFPSARGLLVERGSLLSHSAIVARELGIPAVVSIPGLTDWLSDGDVVELDGAEGVVRRITPEAQNA
ncbi:MAG: PEP/pyruvate-binding domain-containing protein [Terracidiphilus sp.]